MRLTMTGRKGYDLKVFSFAFVVAATQLFYRKQTWTRWFWSSI
jgi:hypothetical protein